MIPELPSDASHPMVLRFPNILFSSDFAVVTPQLSPFVRTDVTEADLLP